MQNGDIYVMGPFRDLRQRYYAARQGSAGSRTSRNNTAASTGQVRSGGADHRNNVPGAAQVTAQAVASTRPRTPIVGTPDIVTPTVQVSSPAGQQVHLSRPAAAPTMKSTLVRPQAVQPTPSNATTTVPSRRSGVSLSRKAPVANTGSLAPRGSDKASSYKASPSAGSSNASLSLSGVQGVREHFDTAMCCGTAQPSCERLGDRQCVAYYHASGTEYNTRKLHILVRDPDVRGGFLHYDGVTHKAIKVQIGNFFCSKARAAPSGFVTFTPIPVSIGSKPVDSNTVQIESILRIDHRTLEWHATF